jgi:periplasmic protein CpxP/Spy
MNRTTWKTAAAVLLAACVALPVMAQPPQGRGGRGFGPGGPGGPGPFPMMRELNLTDAQREQIRAITQQERSAGSPQAKLGPLQKELQLAVLADTPDPQKIEQLKAAVAAATAEALSARVEMETQIAQILTPEQRAQARDALAKAGPPNGPPDGQGPGGRRGRAGR